MFSKPPLTEAFIALFWREFGGDPEERAYADEWVRGVMAERDQMDQIVKVASEHWRLERMTRVDRNVLRLGTWELKYKLDIPRAVVLDEAIELAGVLQLGDGTAELSDSLLQVPGTAIVFLSFDEVGDQQ